MNKVDLIGQRTGVASILVLLMVGVLSAQPTRPAIVSRQAWGSQKIELSDNLLHFPTNLNIHHAGVRWKKGDDPVKKLQGLQVWGQREKDWPDLPYHYLIAPDGRIFEGRDWRYRPESNTDYDLEGTLNVHLWGNFDEQILPQPQLESLVKLCSWLCQEHHVPTTAIRTHQLAAPGQTSCPGQDVQRYFDDGSLVRWVTRRLINKESSTVQVHQPDPKLQPIDL